MNCVIQVFFFCSIMVDETPKPDQVQQLDVFVKFSEAEQHVVEHVHSYSLGRATAEKILSHLEDALH